jgi:hypothetical protein
LQMMGGEAAADSSVAAGPQAPDEERRVLR